MNVMAFRLLTVVIVIILRC